MKKFLALLLIAGGGWFLHTHQAWWKKYAPTVTLNIGAPAAATPADTKAKGPGAWRVIFRKNNGGYYSEVILIDGDRWRIESKQQGQSRIFVAVCDGSATVLTPPSSTPLDLDPRPEMGKVLALAAGVMARANKISPQTTELMDGHACWKTSSSFQGTAEQFWVDARTGDPVRFDGLINNAREECHFSTLPVDVAQRGAEIFDSTHTTALFSYYLTP